MKQGIFWYEYQLTDDNLWVAKCWFIGFKKGKPDIQVFADSSDKASVKLVEAINNIFMEVPK